MIPSLSDKVSRLKHIGKGVTKRLNDEKIYTVKDLLVLLNTNPQRLYQVNFHFLSSYFSSFSVVYCLCATIGNTVLQPLDRKIIGRKKLRDYIGKLSWGTNEIINEKEEYGYSYVRFTNDKDEKLSKLELLIFLISHYLSNFPHLSFMPLLHSDSVINVPILVLKP